MLIDTIKTFQLQARKDRDTVATNLFTTLLGELTTLEVNMRCLVPDTETIKVIQKFIKNNEFTEATLETTGVLVNTKEWEQLQKLKTENSLLKSLLPKQLSEDQLKLIIGKKFFPSNSLPTLQDIMKFLKENYSGQYDGKNASTIAKEFINYLESLGL